MKTILITAEEEEEMNTYNDDDVITDFDYLEDSETIASLIEEGELMQVLEYYNK